MYLIKAVLIKGNQFTSNKNHHVNVRSTLAALKIQIERAHVNWNAICDKNNEP